MNYSKEKMREYMRGRRKVISVAHPSELEGKVVGCANCKRLEEMVQELEGEVVDLKEALLVIKPEVVTDKLTEVIERKEIRLCEHGSARGLCKHGCK